MVLVFTVIIRPNPRVCLARAWGYWRNVRRKTVLEFTQTINSTALPIVTAIFSTASYYVSCQTSASSSLCGILHERSRRTIDFFLSCSLSNNFFSSEYCLPKYEKMGLKISHSNEFIKQNCNFEHRVSFVGNMQLPVGNRNRIAATPPPRESLYNSRRPRYV